MNHYEVYLPCATQWVNTATYDDHHLILAVEGRSLFAAGGPVWDAVYSQFPSEGRSADLADE